MEDSTIKAILAMVATIILAIIAFALSNNNPISFLETMSVYILYFAVSNSIGR